MPYSIVRKFEEIIAEYAGAPYAVAVESGSAAILLSCMYCGVSEVTIPARTYPSVPCSIILAGGSVKFTEKSWIGLYQLKPYNIWDGALRFKPGMYRGGLHCLSFHIKKHLPIGRGGMILCDSQYAYDWLKLARFDGRQECDLNQQAEFTVIGLNAYMTPEQAARGLMLFNRIKYQDLEDLDVESQGYPDLSQSKIYFPHAPWYWGHAVNT